MARWWDSDKALPRGTAPGTRGGKPMRLSSRPASRDLAGAASALAPSPDALLVIRPERRVGMYFLGWVVYVIPLAVLYAVLVHGVAWWLIAIPVLRVLHRLARAPQSWLALTRTELEGRDERVVWSAPRTAIDSIHVAPAGSARIEFADRAGRALASAPLLYTERQLATLAGALAVRVVEDR